MGKEGGTLNTETNTKPWLLEKVEVAWHASQKHTGLFALLKIGTPGMRRG